MASIVGKRRGKQTYYYLVESARVEGKPRIVSQQYLGSVEEVMAKLAETRCGAPARSAAQAVRGSGCGVVDAAATGRGRDRRRGGAPVRERGGVGGHLSRVGDCEPGGRPVLEAGVRRLVGHHGRTAVGEDSDRAALDHRRFWDAMDRLDTRQLREIETELGRRMVTEFGLDLSGLVLDMTNFATYIDTGNDQGADRAARQGETETHRSAAGRVGVGRHPRRRGAGDLRTPTPVTGPTSPSSARSSTNWWPATGPGHRSSSR